MQVWFCGVLSVKVIISCMEVDGAAIFICGQYWRRQGALSKQPSKLSMEKRPHCCFDLNREAVKLILSWARLSIGLSVIPAGGL